MLSSHLLRPAAAASHLLPVRRRSPSPLLLRRRRPSRRASFPATINLKVRASDAGRIADVADGRDAADLPVELCVAYELEPALTLREGVERIKEAVGRLRMEPPCSRSGVVRFEVKVPPSTTAASWYYSQFQSEAFPQFLVYLERQESSESSLYGMTGVAGVGAAIYLNDSSLRTENATITRYLSVDSPLIRAYGFEGTEFSDKSPLETRGDSLSSIFIPQIELNEFKDKSVLASTVVWDDFLCQTFPDAIESAEFSLHHVVDCAGHSKNRLLYNDTWLHTINGRVDVFSAKQVQTVFLSVENQDGARISQCHVPVLEQHWSNFHPYFRLSKTVAFTSGLAIDSGRSIISVNQNPNINSVWASLIVEECVRLGLVYFCIAPGSRSSPLAIAAASHPQTTCISCFDERSLAFHAIGYAKGSFIPAVVITSSGTAVSNLLPAVVEASQDFVPVLLLTADRPPELHDAGANQAINQVDHFGKFVRFFFDLPPPSDEVPARIVLTTVDSAVYNANGTPRGPAHINCCFREPLDNSPREWAPTCLDGLDHWMSNYEPFTTYINLQKFYLFRELSGQMGEILQIIQTAEQGILFIGSVESEDEIWAALLLAKHLSWPVVPDILSGLRIRNMSSPLPHDILFVDHLDHALLSDLVKSWPQPDVVLQLGSRITSRRVAQLLEQSPQKYILVEEHPYRHDPSHVVTHRIQSTITAFTEILLKHCFPMKAAKWRNFLQAMEMMVASDVSSLIHLENSLTEPHVAQVIASVLQGDAVLFIGNSMVIRDMDMYGISVQSATDIACLSSMRNFPYQGIQVVANRGASGIDGLLSSAVGFAAGCNKRVVCLVGDVSFLHDTNGLAILSERMQRRPMTVLVVNNHGGAIFSLLPVAERTHAKILDKFFYTSHNISISKLCAAYCINHLSVQTKVQLQHALFESIHSNTDTVIEVESRISDNAMFHRILRESARQVANHVIKSSLLTSDAIGDGLFFCRISRMGYSLYRVQLSAPPTTTVNQENDHHRVGFILSITLDDGSIGYGEVVPTEIHKEDMIDVEEQLRFLLHTIEGVELSYILPLLRGSFSSWFWKTFGIAPSSLFPSVRCGVEMTVLNALACKLGSSFSEVIFGSGNSLRSGSPSASMDKKIRSDHVQICALVDCGGTPKEVAHVVSSLVEEGFYTIKLKVARRANPLEDAAVIEEIRNSVGYQIHIRADANRRWSYEEAVMFGNNVKKFMIQYIEEPIQCEDDIPRYCDETGLPVALDETIDVLKGDVAFKLSKFIHPGIVAVVIKPNMIGGFEIAALVARWAQLHDKMAVISSTFESGLSLHVYIQFAHYLEQHKALVCRMRKIEASTAIAHGLGTYKWLKEDIGDKHFKFHVHRCDGIAGVFVEDAATMLNNFTVDQRKIQRSYRVEKITSYFSVVDYEYFSCSVRLLETDICLNKKVVVFLHGFLGTSEEWVPIMKALSVNAQCISLDLPGHGQSEISWRKEAGNSPSMSIETVGDMLHQLLCNITTKSVVLVGYSMGARIALYMSLKYSCKIEGVALISGSPGLRQASLKRARTAQDDARARYLSAHGFKPFLEIWYSSSLWNSLRENPLFEQVLKSREKHRSTDGVAKCLSDLSVGRQVSLWENLRQCEARLLLIVGEKDDKFKEIARQMLDEIDSEASRTLCDVVEVEACGHAVHLENPLAVINAVSKFFLRDAAS